MRAPDDLSGLIGDMIRFGTLEAVDLDARLATVQTGDIVSPPLRWLSFAGAFSTYFPPTVGEQVVLLCPEGDITGGVILRGLESDAFPAPASGTLFRIKMPNGTQIDYDPEANALTFDLTGQAVIKAPTGVVIEAHTEITGNVSIIGDVTVTGKIDATGIITSEADVKAQAISLKDHKHGGVTAGMAKTLVPE